MKIRFMGSQWVRSLWPAEQLATQDFDARASNHYWPNPDDDCDLMFIHRPLVADTLARIAFYQSRGVFVIVDEDDDLEHVPKSNIFAKKFTKELRANHEAAIRQADAITVTTTKLLGVYGSWAKRVHLVPNYLPSVVRSARWTGADKSTSVLIGWTGEVGTHEDDLAWLRPAFETLFDGARFIHVGNGSAAIALGIAPTRTIQHPWQYHPEPLYQLMARCHIGIVPLVPSEFNESKSWLKALEYGSLGKPVVVTDLPEQRKLVKHGLNGFLASSPEEFAYFVQMLVRDRDLREQMGRAARERAAGFALHRQISCWTEVLEDARLLHA